MRHYDHGETEGREYHREAQERLRWFIHVKRLEYVGRQTLEMVPPGRRKRGRPKQSEMDGLCQRQHDSYRDDTR